MFRILLPFILTTVLTSTTLTGVALAGIRTCEMTFTGTILSALFLKIGEAKGEMACFGEDEEDDTITPVQINFAGVSAMFAGLCSIDDAYLKLAGVGLKDKDALGLFAQVELGPFIPEALGGNEISTVIGLKLGILNPSISAFSGTMKISDSELCPFPQIVGVTLGEVHDRRLLKKNREKEERLRQMSSN